MVQPAEGKRTVEGLSLLRQHDRKRFIYSRKTQAIARNGKVIDFTTMTIGFARSCLNLDRCQRRVDAEAGEDQKRCQGMTRRRKCGALCQGDGRLLRFLFSLTQIAHDDVEIDK